MSIGKHKEKCGCENIFCSECGSKDQDYFAKNLNLQEELLLNQHKHCKQYRRGEFLFQIKEKARFLFCIQTGKVKLFRVGINDKQQIIRFATEGDIIGYRCLMAGEDYRLTAEAMEDTKVCLIERAYFQQLAENHPEILKEIAKKISYDLINTENHLLSIAQKNVRERIAEFILFLKLSYGTEEDGKTIKFRLSRQEMADYVGTSLESLIRSLSEFNHDKILDVQGRQMCILNHEKLLQTANVLD